MKGFKNISFFFLLTLTALSMCMLSFLSFQKEAKQVRETPFRITAITDQTVTNETRAIPLESYDLSTLNTVHLIVSGTYGTIVLEPEVTNNKPYFIIPTSMTQRAGLHSYALIKAQKTIQKGTFKIFPDPLELGPIATYLGPRSIVANVRDYTMLVSIPTDHLDNLLADNSPVILKSQFKNRITTTTHNVSYGMVWKRIQSPLETGRLSTASILESRSSKELIADVFPDTAKDFILDINSNHTYADGNEMITFRTSQIKDAYNNIMTDGTLVTFSIRDLKNNYWQTTASTVNGYAFAKALHPQSPSTWSIQATIKGIATSPEISQTFVSIIQEIPVYFPRNREVVVGPLTSYLGQLVPEGIKVTMKVEDTVFDGLTKGGKVTFYLKEEYYPKGEYTLNIIALGLETSKNMRIE